MFVIFRLHVIVLFRLIFQNHFMKIFLIKFFVANFVIWSFLMNLKNCLIINQNYILNWFPFWSLKMFDLSDYEKLNHFLSTSDTQDDCFDCFHNPSIYFHFCYFGKIVFIHKARRVYQVLASRSCNFDRIAEHTHFDVISVDLVLFDAINKFYDCVNKLLSKSNSVQSTECMLEF